MTCVGLANWKDQCLIISSPTRELPSLANPEPQQEEYMRCTQCAKMASISLVMCLAHRFPRDYCPEVSIRDQHESYTQTIKTLGLKLMGCNEHIGSLLGEIVPVDTYVSYC
jgi:hypothetical protein